MKETVENFQKITKYKLADYLADFTSFVDEKQQYILNYYRGYSLKPNIAAFNELERLIKESKKIESVFASNKNKFTTGDFWELIDAVQSVADSLLTISNYSRWSRSSITNNNFNPFVEVDKVLGQNQTLERMSREAGYSDEQNDWVNVALRNDIKEEDYTPEGGYVAKISFQNNISIDIQSVVDNLTGENIYGIDIYNKLTFENNDLKVLSYRETITQTIETLINLKKGDNPEFPEDGMQVSLVAGTNIGSVYYPALIRQIYNTFQTKDSIKSIQITNVKQQEDAVFIEFIVETKLSDIIRTSTII